MRASKIAPDAILYNAIIDALWETGVIWAQRKACTALLNPPARLCAPWTEALHPHRFYGVETGVAGTAMPTPYRVKNCQ